MREQAGRRHAPGSRAAALAAAIAVLAVSTGTGRLTSPSSGAAARAAAQAHSAAGAIQARSARGPTTAAERKMKAIITAWSVRLNRNDNRGVAELYSLPTLITQAPNTYRLTTRSQVALFFSLLPCAGKVVSISYHRTYAIAVFRLGNRGTAPCDDPGALAAARFGIVGGKIVTWAQVAVPGHSAPAGQIA